jgi:CBS domain-containing protein
MQPNPVAVEANCPLRNVLALMNQLRIGAVIVVTPERALVGIFTERDLLLRVAESDPSWRELPVSSWMTSSPHSVVPDMSWEEGMALMVQRRVRHLPVVEDGRVIGIVSAGDLMSRRADHLNRQVEERTPNL